MNIEILGKILEILILAFLLKGVYNFIRAAILRRRLIGRLRKIGREKGYTLRRVRPGIAAFFRVSDCPDLVLTTPEAEYRIRLLTCRSRKRFYHFVTPEYYVRYRKFYFAVVGVDRTTGLRLFETFRRLPPYAGEWAVGGNDGNEENNGHDGHDGDSGTDSGTKAIRPVILADPAPLRFTVAEDRPLNAPGGGKQAKGWWFFSGSGFADFLETQ